MIRNVMQPVPVERFVQGILDRLVSCNSFICNIGASVCSSRYFCCRSQRRYFGLRPTEEFVDSSINIKNDKFKDGEKKNSPILGLGGSHEHVPPNNMEILARVAEAYKKRVLGADGTSLIVENIDEQNECVICLEFFSRENPEMHTLCGCGANKTSFHYSCLLLWMEKDNHCPACRGKLYFEEMPAFNETEVCI